VELVARTAALVYIYARISQIAKIHTSLYSTTSPVKERVSSHVALAKLKVWIFSTSERSEMNSFSIKAICPHY
jgi:hypothetical protein